MKTCKHCYHFDACVDKLGTTKFYDNVMAANNVEDLCKTFKDKSLDLDLPCKVGDTVYYAGIDTPVRFNVIGFSQGRMYCDNLEEYSELLDEGDIVEGEWYVHLDTTYGLSQMSPISEFGRTIFIGKNAEKAAEQALKERTDNEIIKALECHRDKSLDSCSICPLLNIDGCAYLLSRNALDLINRQKAEIERLQELLKGWKTEAYKVADEKDKLYCEAVKRVKTTKAEAIKEFAEKAVINLAENYSNEYCHWIGDTIDNLVKEMVGED